MQRQKAKSDEWYTPIEAVKVIVPYLDKFKRIWCPFDTKESYFVKELSKSHKVVCTHIATGDDFFETNVNCDVIVSNPPFSRRNDVYKRLFDLGKPFAMVDNVASLFDAKDRFNLFSKNSFEIMPISPRVKFITPITGVRSSPTYQSAYVCHNVLPKQIVFEVMK